MVYGFTKCECMVKYIFLCYETMKWNTNELYVGKGMKMKKENEYENDIYVHSHLVLNATLGM